jgi:hypothetical protein
MIKEINILDITFTSGNETEINDKFIEQKYIRSFKLV